MTNRRGLMIVVVIGVAALCGASTKVVMSWKNPTVPETKFHRVLALGLSNKTETRADFEDTLAAELTSKGYDAVPANTILLRPSGTDLDLNYLKGQIKSNQIEAVVVSRLVKVENKENWVPGSAYYVPYPYYNTFWGYYGTLYPVIYTPGYLEKEKKVRIETNLYLVTGSNEGQLVWTGVTDTFNPDNVHKAVKKLVQLVVSKMQKEGALQGA